MVYWLFFPLSFSVGLLAYVYATHPRERDGRLFVLWMLCTALNTVSTFIAATTDLDIVARWAILLHALLTFGVSGVVLGFLALELAWQRAAKPKWVKGYIALAIVSSALSGIVILSDHLGQSSVFYGALVYSQELGYVRAAGEWPIGLQLIRLIPVWGALGILAWHFGKADRRRRVALGPVLLALLIVPVVENVLFVFAGQSFPGSGIAADFLLVLALGYATSQHLFAMRPAITGLAARQIVDSMTEGVVVLDAAGRVLSVNHVAEQLLGVTEPQAVYRSCAALFASWGGKMADPGALDLFLEESQTQPEQICTHEVQIGGEAEHRHIRLRISPIRNRRDRILGHVAWLTDMTTVRDREEGLQNALAEQSRLAATLTELTSPVLPVMEHAIVLPLAGHIDATRANLISDALLEGIKMHRARIAILDLTGVLFVSPEAVSMLLETIDAVRLLGADPMLVGIQPQVAETLSDLDFDARSLIVQTDLQAGLLYALRSRSTPVRS
jgi:anti-anti-sigma factor